NIFVLPENKHTKDVDTTAATDGPVIAFVDFGMVGAINKNTKQAMKDVFLSFITRDSHALVNAFSRLGFIGEGANIASIERGMSLMMQNYFGMTLGEVRGLNMPDVAQDVENLLYGQ